MKKTAILFSILFILSFCSTVYAVEVSVDGIVNKYEWQNANDIKLFDTREDSGCNINTAIIKHQYDSNLRELYIAFLCTEDYISPQQQSDCYVELSINNGSTITINNEAVFDNTMYHVECSKTNSLNNSIIESYIILKDVGYNKIDMVVCFVDSEGVASKKFEVILYDEGLMTNKTETTFVQNQNVEQSKSTTKKVTTTKQKTTKAKTTKDKNIKTTTPKTTKLQTLTMATKKQELSETTTVNVINSDSKMDVETKTVIKTIAAGGIVVSIVAYVAGILKKSE